MAAEPSQESKGGLLSQALHYWHVLLNWKWIASLFLIVCVAAATIYSLMLPPVYIASGTVWIEDEPNILPFEEVQTFGTGTNLQSHARLIRSRTLASETIDKLKLYENPDFVGKPKKDAEPRDPADPRFRELLVQGFLDNLGVSSGERTRLVDVRFSNRNPKLAADILNALFDSYIEMMVTKRYSASKMASGFLDAQMAELRTEIEDRDREMNKYGSEKDILPLTAAEAPTVTRIAEVNKRLTDATIDRVNKLNRYNQLKAAPLGEIPDAPEGSLIQRLREQYLTLNRQYRTRLATVRPEYPEMQRTKSELDSATEALLNETQSLIRNAYNDYQAALQQEQALRGLLDSQKNEAFRANSSSVVYNSLRIEIENRKSLLEALSKRKSETDVSSRLKGYESLNVWIVDKADYPLSPASPNKRKNVLMGFLIGLAGGIGLALGLEFLNNTVRTSQDVVKSTGLPLMGSIPSFEADASSKGPIGEIAQIIRMFSGNDEGKGAKEPRKKAQRAAGFLEERTDPTNAAIKSRKSFGRIELIAKNEPTSIQAESYRSIRTTLLVSSPPGKIKTILFTSPLAREGKSATVSNLGIMLAEVSRRVVIVDSDLRKPKLARIFGAGAGPGISRYLSSNMDPADLAKPTGIPNLDLIVSGPMPANPIEILTSDRMDGLVTFLKRNYDFTLFDTPPVLAVSDALAMGPMIDAIILIARGGQTPIQAMSQAKLKLDAHKLKCLGVILNGIDIVAQDGYYAKQYYHYSKTD
jgi:succinoglycan biosynthesis transport protein ExoP